MKNIKKKILIIGAEVGEGLAAILPSEGYDTKFIESYSEPLPFDEIFSEVSKGKYDLVIVSYWNCWEALLAVRERFPEVKTMFLNSYKIEWDEIARKRGVNAVLRAPDELDNIVGAINKLLV